MLYAQDVEQAVRVSEVNQQIGRLRGNLETLKEQIAMAREKLRPVMNECKGTGNSEQNSPEPVLCPLASELRNIAGEVDLMCEALGSVIRSVEV